MNPARILSLGGPLVLAGCMVAAAPTSPSLHATISLLPAVREGGYRAQAANYTASDINHLQVKLFKVASGSETPVTGAGGLDLTLDLPAASLSVPLTFANLAYNTSYRVRAYAYSDAGTASRISTTDSGSYVDVSVLMDDRPVMGTLPIKLLDRFFRGAATISAGVDVIAGGLATSGPAAAGNDWRVELFAYDSDPWGIGGVAVDSQGYVWVADSFNGAIHKFGKVGRMNSNDGTSSGLSFSGPTGLAFDPSGNLIIADTGHNRICKMTPQGAVSVIAGQGAPGYFDGPGTLAEFSAPTGVAVDASGTIYVAERQNATIRKITTDNVVSRVAGHPWADNNSRTAVDGATSSAGFYQPVGVVVDSHHNLFVLDDYGCEIRKIDPDGVVSTFAGTFFSTGSTDGATSSARFKRPQGLAIDRHDNLYVADMGNQEIRMVTPQGLVSTFAGSTTSGSMDGLASIATFYNPRAIAVESSGTIYVGDDLNHSIRMIH